MKGKLIFCICAILYASGNLSSQDLITKVDSTQIQVRLIEVNKDFVFFKDYNDSSSPIDSISVDDVYTINVEKKAEDILDSTFVRRKGIHLGLSLIPSYGKYSDEFSYASNYSIDFDIYFSNKAGLRTGLRYSKYNIGYDLQFYRRDTSGSYIPYEGNITGYSQILGIPFKYIYSTQKRLAFFIEAGIIVYFYDYTDGTKTIPYYDLTTNKEIGGLYLSWDIETSLGINYTIKEKTNLKFGLAGGFSPSTRYYVGAQIGATFLLSKH